MAVSQADLSLGLAYASLEPSILGGDGRALGSASVGVSLPGAKVLGSVPGQACMSDIHSCPLSSDHRSGLCSPLPVAQGWLVLGDLEGSRHM